MEASLSWPFEVVVDETQQDSGWRALHGPLVTAAQHEQFAELRRAGARFVGITSYLDFPRRDARDGLDYETICEAWCHCFREPAAYFKQSAPRALISASDFTDWRWVERNAAMAPPWTGANYDYVYVGVTETAKREAKNWPLAARCIPLLYQQLGLRALVVGRSGPLPAGVAGITFLPRLGWSQLLAAISAAKFVFLPNRADPSPRVIAEALCLDVPIVVHHGILGGWKYVNRFTGCMFDGAHDVTEAASQCLQLMPRPRSWFRAHYGPDHAGRRLADLLRPLDRSLAGRSSLRVSAAGPGSRGAA